MEAIIQNTIEGLSLEELALAQEAASEVLRQYDADPTFCGRLVMMAFN